jgi:hypothetical protein
LLDEAWAGFARAVLPPGCSAVQRQGMRRAFYSGAFSALVHLMTIADDSVSEEQGMAILDALHQECHEFNNLVKSGRA